MYYKRRYKNGMADWDVRQKEFAVFYCDACKKEIDIDITYNSKFDFSQQRKCPRCNSYGKEDKINKLKVKLKLRKDEMKNIKSEIEEIIKELNKAEICQI